MVRKPTVKKTFRFGIAGVAFVTVGCGIGGPHGSVIEGTRNSTAFEKNVVEPINDLRLRAQTAEKSGDYAKAEDLLKQCNAIMPGTATYDLAELHEKVGNFRAALADYKVLIGPKGGGGSDQLMITRCADLDMLYGSKAEARKEYLAASKQPIDFVNKAFTPVAAGEDVSIEAPLDTLRACAYFNAGNYYRGQGSPKGRNYLELALSLEPRSALMRFGYARLGGVDGRAEDWLAEQEATGPLKAALHKWRAEGNELVGSGSLYFVKGVPHMTTTPYAPKGPISTPHIPDPIKLGNPRWADAGASVSPVP